MISSKRDGASHEGSQTNRATWSSGRSCANDFLLPALAAVGVQLAAMLAVARIVAILVYQKLGVDIPRKAWINLDLVWVGALTVTGAIAHGLGLWPFLIP